MSDEKNPQIGSVGGGSFFSQRILERIAATAAIIGTLISAYALIAERVGVSRQLSIQVHQPEPLLASAVSRPSDIELIYKGEKVLNPVQLKATLRNSGKSPILISEIESPVRLTVTQGRLIRAELQETSPSGLEVSLKSGETFVEIIHKLINPGDAISVILLLDGNIGHQALVGSARIAGVSNIDMTYPDAGPAKVTAFDVLASYLKLPSATLFPGKMIIIFLAAGLLIAAAMPITESWTTIKGDGPVIKDQEHELTAWEIVERHARENLNSSFGQERSMSSNVSLEANLDSGSLSSSKSINVDLNRFCLALCATRPPQLAAWLLSSDGVEDMTNQYRQIGKYLGIDLVQVHGQLAAEFKEQVTTPHNILTQIGLSPNQANKLIEANLIPSQEAGVTYEVWIQNIKSAVNSRAGQRAIRNAQLSAAAETFGIGAVFLTLAIFLSLVGMSFIPANWMPFLR